MMKFLSTAVLSLVLFGCLQTRSEIAGRDERAVAQKTVVTPTQQVRADQEARLQNLEENFRQLNGRIESLEYKLNADSAAKNKEQAERALVQKQMLEQMKLFEDAILRLEQRGASAAAPAPSQSNTAVAAAVSSGGKDRESALWGEAETLFNAKEWKQSILAYQKYRDENPKGKNFAEATYRIGVAFQEIGKKDEAKVFFQEVVEKFPKTSAARKAQYRQKSLK